MIDPITYFITWTTYGTWLPGDARGWRKTRRGGQLPQPRLETWCRERLTECDVLLNESQRGMVEDVCREHATIRGWILHAVNARCNHVHLAVTADKGPKVVRDQFKANATRVLRQQPDGLLKEKIWTRGGDCEIIDGDDELERVIEYITAAQGRMSREK
jgi:REP element-mobilizing transposase RayT